MRAAHLCRLVAHAAHCRALSRRLYTLLAFVSLLIYPTVVAAQSDAYVLRICNQGNISVSVAMVRHKGGNLFGLLGGSHVSEGWWSVSPGACENVYDQIPGDGGWLAFTFHDRAGVWRSAPTAPEGWQLLENRSRRTLFESNRAFCVAKDKFAYDGNLDDLARCAGVPNHYLIPFTVAFARPVLTGGETTFTIRPDINAPGRPIEGSRATTAGSPTPTVSSPKPRQSGTHNAMYQGKPVVRAPNGRQWFDEAGKLFATDPAPELFDYPGSNPASLAALLSMLTTRTEILVQRSAGRLVALAKFEAAQGVEKGASVARLTFNLQALDFSSASHDATRKVMSIPCSEKKACTVYQAGDLTFFLDAVPLPVADENAFKTTLATLRKAAGLFPQKTPPTAHQDASCACWIYR